MKKGLKVTLSVLSSVLIIGTFIVTCIFTYRYEWNQAAFWWSWFGIVWLVDIFVGGYLFYKRNRTDETKTFWLFIMVILPIVGGVIALIYNFKLRTEYGNPDNDHAKLQSIIFRAKKSIKIYSNSFYVTNDTFNALNFARWKGVNIQMIISVQPKKSKQDFLVYKLQKSLEEKVELYITDKEINDSFIIIDNEQILQTPKNFNFKTIYSEKNINLNADVNRYLHVWNNDLERCSNQSLKKGKINPFKKVKFKLINIFYPFF